MNEAAELLTLWGSALSQGQETGGAAAELDDAELDCEDDGGCESEWGLPLLGVDLSALAGSGFSVEEAEAQGFAALLAAAPGGPAGGQQQGALAALARAGGLLGTLVWCSLRGLPPPLALPALAQQLAALPLLDGAALRRALPLPSQGQGTVVLVAPGGALVAGLRLPLPGGGEQGSAAGALWDALSETLLSRACAFHASTCVCSGDVQAWAASRRGSAAGRAAAATGPPSVHLLLPLPQAATWGPAQRSALSLWRTIATPRGAQCQGLEAVRALLEASHRTLLFKWALLGEVEALASLAASAAAAALTPPQPWHTLHPRALASNPLLRALLPLCDRQFNSSSSSSSGGAVAEEEGLQPHPHLHTATAALCCAVRAALEEAAAAAAAAARDGAAPASHATEADIDWAASAAPSVCEVLDAWEGAIGCLPWRSVDKGVQQQQQPVPARLQQQAKAGSSSSGGSSSGGGSGGGGSSSQVAASAGAGAGTGAGAGAGEAAALGAMQRLMSRVNRASPREPEQGVGPSWEDIQAGRLIVGAPREHVLRGQGGRAGGVLGNAQGQVLSVLDSISAFREGEKKK